MEAGRPTPLSYSGATTEKLGPELLSDSSDVFQRTSPDSKRVLTSLLPRLFPVPVPHGPSLRKEVCLSRGVSTAL